MELYESSVVVLAELVDMAFLGGIAEELGSLGTVDCTSVVDDHSPVADIHHIVAGAVVLVADNSDLFVVGCIVVGHIVDTPTGSLAFFDSLSSLGQMC